MQLGWRGVPSSACTVSPSGFEGQSRVDCWTPAARREALQGYADGDARDPRVRALALALVDRLPVLSPALTARALLAAVQRRVRYVGEAPPDLWSSSLTTWATRAGDCDDSARLLVALLLALGVPARIETIERPNGEGHASVKVQVGGVWSWADPSVPGATFGEDPRSAFARSGGSMWPAVGGLSGLGALSMSHASIRAMILDSFARRGLHLGPASAQAVQTVSLQESGYGRGWKPPMVGSHNMGAIQRFPRTDPCPVGSVPYGDSHRNGEKYAGCFRVYDTDQAGIDDLVAVLWAHPLRRAAFIAPRSIDQIATALIRSVYAEGRGASEGAAIATEVAALFPAARRIARELPEPLYLPRAPRWGWAVVALGLGSAEAARRVRR